MAAPIQKQTPGNGGIYFLALVLGITGVWMINLSELTGRKSDFFGKFVASVVLLILVWGFFGWLGWSRNRKRQQQIRGAVITRRPTPEPEEPPKD